MNRNNTKYLITLIHDYTYYKNSGTSRIIMIVCLTTKIGVNIMGWSVVKLGRESRVVPMTASSCNRSDLKVMPSRVTLSGMGN